MNDGLSLQIVARMLLRETEPAALWRVVLVEAPFRAWLAPVHEEGWPHLRDLTALRDQIEAGHVLCEQTDPFLRRAVTTLSADSRHIERDRRRWSAIEPLVEGRNLSVLMHAQHRGVLLRQRAVESGMSYQGLVNLLWRYWARGMSSDAVASDYAACGAKGRHRRLINGKPGPVRRSLDASGNVIALPGVIRTEEVCDHFKHGASLHLGKGWTLKRAWLEILRLWWSNIAFDEEGEPVGCIGEEYPTFRQFQNFVATRFPEVERRKRLMGQKTYDLSARALPGRADGDTDGPGSRFEIDATIADTYLVSRYDRTRIVGRPTIYFVVDVWSRLIVGLYVGFEAPSWVGAISALVNAATPKVGFCQSFGREIEDWEWPSRHLPSKVLGDRGEMISLASGQNLAGRLHVHIENTPPGRGDLKSIVERRFGIVPSIYKDFVPGYVRPDFGERGAEDYRKAASLTLREFTSIMIEAVLEHNRTPPDGRLAEPGMVADGLTASPLHYWSWGVANRSGSLAQWDPDLVALNLFPGAKARMSARGVQFHGGVYSCPELEMTDWLVAARAESAAVEVTYDPRCMDVVYLRDERLRTGFLRLDRKWGGVERGASLAEIQENWERSKVPATASERPMLEQSIKSNMRIRRITDQANAATAAARGGKPVMPKDLAGIRDNKAREKALNRPAEVLMLAPPPARDAINDADPPAILNVIPHHAEVVSSGGGKETPRERLLRQKREREDQDG